MGSNRWVGTEYWFVMFKTIARVLMFKIITLFVRYIHGIPYMVMYGGHYIERIERTSLYCMYCSYCTNSSILFVLNVLNEHHYIVCIVRIEHIVRIVRIV